MRHLQNIVHFVQYVIVCRLSGIFEVLRGFLLSVFPSVSLSQITVVISSVPLGRVGILQNPRLGLLLRFIVLGIDIEVVLDALYAFFKNLSWSYAEAAQIDGAGHFHIYFRIMLPIAMPALISVGVLLAIGFWNDYFTIYMYAPEKATIAYGIQRISAQAGVNMPQVFAAMMLSIVPVLIVFACFQKTIMQNTAIGGLKG